jgi:hypothetical protein
MTSPLIATPSLQDIEGLFVRPLNLTQWLPSYLLPKAGDPSIPTIKDSPAGLMKYLNGRRETILEAKNLRPLVRVADKDLNVMTELEGEISASYEELANDTGQVNISIRYDNHIADWMIHQTRNIEDLHILIDPNPLKPDWRTRWGGKIDEIHIKHDDQGVHTIEIHALSFREHAKRLLVAANPIFPPEIQLPRMWVLGGPCRSILSLTMFINLARIFFPALSIPSNIFNPAAWINPLGPDALMSFDPLSWPLQVAFVNPALDQSRWTSVGATWTTWHEAFKDILTDAGCQFRAYTWLTTDEDSPHTELADIMGGEGLVNLGTAFFESLTGIPLSNLLDVAGVNKVQELARPKRNCVVFAIDDKSGRTGISGTAIDGLVNLIGVTLDDLITPVVMELGPEGILNVIDAGLTLNGERIEEASGVDQTYLFEKLLGAAPAPPKVIWWQGQYAGMNTTDLTFHKGAVKTIMTGGKSPTIVNEAQTFAIRYALAQLSSVIDMVFFGAYQTPGSPGLDNLYQGQLDNILFAWQRFTDPIRALFSGDFAWNEHFEKGSGTAYVLASILTLRAGNFKTREYASFKATTLNGHPWLANVDFFLGDRVGFEEEVVIYVDQVTSIKYEWDRQKAMTVTVTIGEDRDKQDPFAAAFRTLANVWAGVGNLAGQGWLFG